MAPPKMNFQSGFLNDTSDLDESKLDDSLCNIVKTKCLLECILAQAVTADSQTRHV